MVHGVLLGAGGDAHACRGADGIACAADLLGVDGAGEGIGDRAVAGAPAQVSLEVLGKVVELLGRQRGRRGDHARGAEAALEPRGLDESPLHRMRSVGGAEARHRRDVVSRCAERGEHAGVHGCAVDQHRARAAVARVAALLHLEVTVLAQVGAQALPGPRITLQRLPIDGHGHSNSAQICSASTRVIARRQSGSPCGSSVHASSGMPACARRHLLRVGRRREGEDVGAHRRRGHRHRQCSVGVEAADHDDAGATQRRRRQLAVRGAAAQCRRRQMHGAKHVAGGEDVGGRAGDELRDRHPVVVAVGAPHHDLAAERGRQRDHRAGGKGQADVAAHRRGPPDLEGCEQRGAALVEQRCGLPLRPCPTATASTTPIPRPACRWRRARFRRRAA